MSGGKCSNWNFQICDTCGWMKKQTVIGARESRGGGVNETISLKISKIVRKRI